MQMTLQIAPNEAKWQQKAEEGKAEVEKLKHYEYYYELQEKSKQTNQQRGAMGEGEAHEPSSAEFFRW